MPKPTAYDLIEDYSKQMENDTHIDATNVMEKQMSSPNIKHKWLYKLVQSKKELIRLYNEKEDLLNNRLKDNPLGLSNAIIKKKTETDDTARVLIRDIRDQELLVEFLEKAIDKIFGQMGFDFKNLVELIKMEQL